MTAVDELDPAVDWLLNAEEPVTLGAKLVLKAAGRLSIAGGRGTMGVP